MKINYALSLLLLLLVVAFSGCKKDTIISNDKNVGISKITYYATFDMTGPAILSIVKGNAFTEPGIKATAGGSEVPVTTVGSVDASTVGVYVLTYEASNSDGYVASTSRTVIIIPTAELPGTDLSGDYDAVPVGSTPSPAHITKVAPGAYYTTNCWGNSGAVIPAYFICTDGSTIDVPVQASPYGALKATMPATISAGLITWTIDLIDNGLVKIKKWQKQ